MQFPLYGFMEGDTMGLLIVADQRESVAILAQRLQEAASLRVELCGPLEVVYQDKVLDPTVTLLEAGIKPLQRFDVRRTDGISETRNDG
jgi:hypothetical protein